MRSDILIKKKKTFQLTRVKYWSHKFSTYKCFQQSLFPETNQGKFSQL